MTPRPATARDYPAIRRIHAAFLASRGQSGTWPLSETKLQRMIDKPTEAVWVDPPDKLVRLTAHEVRLEVVWLFPLAERGADNMDELMPLLVAAGAAMFEQQPQTASGKWYAQFPHGQDSNGVPDAGRSTCEAWQAKFGNAQVVRLEGSGLWEIRGEGASAERDALTDRIQETN